ncbi:MAG: hypothetical protein M9953_07705 [Thermomicrobiales bacterium]|nr:hypothetical protein [Thermomicrobiales bacterium]MCO5225206.1 hypothetical protein [Thermomicrobiales bacterium]MCO5227027.1 hypothetical protein [Thermomicrobiales bacterium]
MISPILIVVMLVSQFSTVMAMQPKQTQDIVTSEAHEDSDSRQWQDVLPTTTENNTPSAVLSDSTFATQNFLQSDTTTGTVSVYMSPDTGSDFRLVIPAVMDDSDWPNVTVSILNPNEFWVAIQPEVGTDASISAFGEPWGKLLVIPPGESAEFDILFSSYMNSSFEFYVDGSMSTMPKLVDGEGLGLPGGGFYTLADLLFSTVTLGFVPLERLFQGMSASTTEGADVISELFETVDCYKLQAGVSGGSGFLDIVQNAYRCLTSPEVFNTADMILSQNELYEEPLGRPGELLQIADVFSTLLVSGYQLARSGTAAATITFESNMAEYGTVAVHQVDGEENPVAGGCYTVRESANPDSRRLGTACDEDDGSVDGTIMVHITRQTASATLRNSTVVAGYARPADQGIEIVRDQTVDVTVELERGTTVTVLVVDEEGQPVPDACFFLTPFAMGDERAECDLWDFSSDGIITFDNVASGRYILTQFSDPLNHVGIEGQEVVVEKDTPRTITVVNRYSEYGSLTINLTGSDGSLPTGSCFNVYKNEQSARKFVARLCDEASGMLELNGIIYGEYELESVVVPAGYAHVHPLPFVILGGKQSHLDVLIPSQGALEIHHVDEFGVLVGYGCFELTETYSVGYGEDGVWKTQKCDLDGDGVTLLEGLRPGAYQVEQILGSGSQQWTTTTHSRAPQTSVMVVEGVITPLSMVSLTTVEVRLHTQGEDGNAIVGACYHLASIDTYPIFLGSISLKACDSDDGSSDGVTTIPAPPGVYRVWSNADWELSVYHQYPEVVEIEVPASVGVYDHTVTILDAGTLVVSAIDKATGDFSTEGYLFDLYERIGESRGNEWVMWIWIGDEPVYEGHIPPGDYYLVSEIAEIPDTPITIVANQETSVTVAVGHTQADLPFLHISTVDEYGELVPGACYSADRGLIASYESCDLDDGIADGITSIYLPKTWSTYFVRQTVSPSGGSKPVAQFVSVNLEAQEPGIELTFNTSIAGATLTISALDDETGLPVYACYYLEFYPDLPIYERCTSAETAGDTVQFDSLPEGEYELFQTTDELEQQIYEYPRQSISLATGEQRTMVIRNLPWPTLEFHSTHPNGEPLLGACYQTKPFGVESPEEFCDKDDGLIDGVVKWNHRIYPYRGLQQITGYAPSEHGYGFYNQVIMNFSLVEMPIHVQYMEASYLVIDFVDSQSGELLDVGSICRQVGMRPLNSTELLSPINCSDNLRIPVNPGQYRVSVDIAVSASDYSAENSSYSFSELTLTSGGDTHVEIPVFLKPSLVIQNRDGSGTLVPGVCYSLVYDFTNSQTSCDDDDDGIVVFAHLNRQTYTLKELNNRAVKNYLPVENMVISVSNAPGDISLTIDRLRAGSLSVLLSSAQCVDIWARQSNGLLGERIFSDRDQCVSGTGWRFDRMKPGDYVTKVTDLDGNFVVDIPFVIAEGQLTTVDITGYTAVDEVLFVLQVPDSIHVGVSAIVSVTATDVAGGDMDLSGYTFQFQCPGLQESKPVTDMQAACLFTESGMRTVRVRVTRPDMSSFEISATVIVVATLSTPTPEPTEAPTATPTETPTEIPTETPTEVPSETPTEVPTETPTATPTETPTESPTEVPTETPTEPPTETPTEVPTEVPTETPTEVPSETPTTIPSETPTEVPTETPTEVPTETPTEVPTATPVLLIPGTPILQGNACIAGEYVAPWIDYGVMPDNLEIDGYVDSANGTFMVIATIVGDDRAWAVDSLPAGWTTTYNPAAIVYNGTYVAQPCTEIPTEVPYASPVIPTAVPTQMPTQTPPTIPTPVPTAVPTEIVVTEPTGVPTELPTSVPTSTSPTEGVGDSIGDQSLVVVITLPNGQSIEGAPYELYGATASMSMLAPVAQGVVGPNNTIVINDILPGQYRLVVYLSNTAPLQLSVSVGMTPLTLVQVEVKSDGSVIVTDTTSSGSGSQTPGGSGTGAPAAGGSQSVSGLPSTGAGPGPTMLIPLAVAILCLGILSSWRPVRSGLKRVRGR